MQSNSDITDKFQFYLADLLHHCDYIIAFVLFANCTLNIKIIVLASCSYVMLCDNVKTITLTWLLLNLFKVTKSSLNSFLHC